MKIEKPSRNITPTTSREKACQAISLTKSARPPNVNVAPAPPASMTLLRLLRLAAVVLPLRLPRRTREATTRCSWSAGPGRAIGRARRAATSWCRSGADTVMMMTTTRRRSWRWTTRHVVTVSRTAVLRRRRRLPRGSEAQVPRRRGPLLRARGPRSLPRD